MYKYWGYGLTIASEIEFPELFPYEFEEADLNITIGNTPESLSGESLINKVRLSITPEDYLQTIKGVANYYAANGESILVEPLPGADYKSIRLFLLSNAMAAVLHQRNTIPFHASAIHYKDGVVLFCGNSGAGKSTTVTNLQTKGYKVFSDDVCVLKEGEQKDEMFALPSYPVVKLWADSFVKSGLELASENDQLRPGIHKYARCFHEGYEIEPRKILQVFILVKDKDIQDAEISRLFGLDAFKLLGFNSYRLLQTNAMKKRNIHFSNMSRLASTVPVFKIRRSDQSNTIAKVIALIESNLPL